MLNNTDNENIVLETVLEDEITIPTEISEEAVAEIIVEEKEEVVPEVVEKPVAPKVEEKKPQAPKAAKKAQKIAVHSTRNVTWSEVGKVYIGYNIVTQEQADKWLTRDHIRLATPEEVAKEFGL